MKRTKKRQINDGISLSRTTLREELLRLKEERFPEDEFDRSFLKASGLNRATIGQVRDQSVPSIGNLLKWVKACGLQLSEFFTVYENALTGDGTKASKNGSLHAEHRLISTARVLAERGDPNDIQFVQGLMERLVP